MLQFGMQATPINQSCTVPMTQPVLRVALAVPLRASFDYLAPENVSVESLLPGIRLRVPFGRGERIGLLLETVAEPSVARELLKPATAVLDSEPLISKQQLDYLRWVAGYYHHPSGEVFLSALPVWLRKGEALLSTKEPAWQISETGKNLDIQTLGRAKRQQAMLDCFKQSARSMSTEDLKNADVYSRDALKSLVDKGYLEETSRALLAIDNFEKQQDSTFAQQFQPELNAEQQAAVAAVLNQKGFHVSLLFGITGSGKTEVYLSLAQHMLDRNKQALLLVPEISLTPQLFDRFQKRFQSPVVALHSGLSERERALAWQQAATGEARVVIGTRSAVFTRLPELGIVIVDEEHDQSYKQQEGFRYSARDMAVVQGQQFDCPVLLGSATPSFESLHNALKGSYQYLKLTQRAGNAVEPAIDLIDLRSVRLNAGFSPVTRRLIAEQLEQKNQVMVFLNRRGFAPVQSCHDCGWVAQCHRCDARMTVHAGRKRLMCHHCGYQQRIPVQCPDCKSENLITLGQGTEQVENVMNDLFPGVSIVRIDHDSTRQKGSMREKLEAVRQGRHQLLIGTQMLAKGHDFPNVTLVVIMDIDHGLYGSDFRSTERMAQLLLQVAGRAGRADKPGRVLIQTRHPDHPVLHSLIGQGYEAFARQSLQERREAGFPPAGFQVLIRAESARFEVPEKFLRLARNLGQKQLDKKSPDQHIEFWGPVPAVMQRKKGVYRFQLLLQATNRQALHHFLDNWLAQIEMIPEAKKVRWSVDIDPQDFYS